jgi:hypothetical protein
VRLARLDHCRDAAQAMVRLLPQRYLPEAAGLHVNSSAPRAFAQFRPLRSQILVPETGLS